MRGKRRDKAAAQAEVYKSEQGLGSVTTMPEYYPHNSTTTEQQYDTGEDGSLESSSSGGVSVAGRSREEQAEEATRRMAPPTSIPPSQLNSGEDVILSSYVPSMTGATAAMMATTLASNGASTLVQVPSHFGDPPPYHQPHNYFTSHRITSAAFQGVAASFPKYHTVPYTALCSGQMVPFPTGPPTETVFLTYPPPPPSESPRPPQPDPVPSPPAVIAAAVAGATAAGLPRRFHTLPVPLNSPAFESALVPPTAVFPPKKPLDWHTESGKKKPRLQEPATSTATPQPAEFKKIVFDRNGKLTRTRNLPKETTEILKQWLLDHSKNPYPTEAEKEHFVEKFGMDLAQVNNWFINGRRRVLGLKGFPSEKRATLAEAGDATGQEEGEEGLQNSSGRRSSVLKESGADAFQFPEKDKLLVAHVSDIVEKTDAVISSVVGLEITGSQELAKYQNTSDWVRSQHFEDALLHVMREGITLANQKRPSDPLEFMAFFLLRKA